MYGCLSMAIQETVGPKPHMLHIDIELLSRHMYDPIPRFNPTLIRRTSYALK